MLIYIYIKYPVTQEEKTNVFSWNREMKAAANFFFFFTSYLDNSHSCLFLPCMWTQRDDDRNRTKRGRNKRILSLLTLGLLVLNNCHVRSAFRLFPMWNPLAFNNKEYMGFFFLSFERRSITLHLMS